VASNPGTCPHGGVADLVTTNVILHLGRVEPVHAAGSDIVRCIAAYPQANVSVCRDVVALAQQERLQYLSCSSFLLYACTKQSHHYCGHELN
jgi:hypothetical protein